MRSLLATTFGVVLFLFAGTTLAARGDDWPQWLGPRRDGVWREDGILTKFPPAGPKVLWRAELGGGFTGPAVADGRVFVTDRQGDQLPRGAEAPKKPRSGRPVTERALAAALAGKTISGPQKTRLLRAVNHLIEQKKGTAVDLKALF